MAEPEADLVSRLQEVEALLREVEAWPDPVARTQTQAVVRAVLALHRAGLSRLQELARESERTAPGLIDSWGRDPLVAPLLLLHDLHPLGLEDRVAAALQRARPALRALGTTVDGFELREHRLHLRVQMEKAPCQGTAERVRLSLEEALLVLAPDAPGLEIERAADPTPAGFVPIRELRLAARGRPR